MPNSKNVRIFFVVLCLVYFFPSHGADRGGCDLFEPSGKHIEWPFEVKRSGSRTEKELDDMVSVIAEGKEPDSLKFSTLILELKNFSPGSDESTINVFLKKMRNIAKKRGHEVTIAEDAQAAALIQGYSRGFKLTFRLSDGSVRTRSLIFHQRGIILNNFTH